MKTPCYIFSNDQLYSDYASMKNKLNEVVLHYSLKPNANKNIIRMLNQFNCHFEFSSCNEFDFLKDEKVSTNHMIFGLPIKEIDDIIYLYNHGIEYFVFDSINELEKLMRYACNANKICRLNVMHLGSKNISYGMRFDELEEMFQKNSPYLKYFDGFSFHITKNTEIEAELQILDEIETLLDRFDEGQIKIINIGGGYRLTTPDEYYTLLNKKLKQMKEKYNILFYAEPGRGIVQNCGRILTKVMYTKKVDEVVEVYIDAGYATGLTYEKINNVTVESDAISSKQRIIYTFFDNTCMKNHLFSLGIKQVLEPGMLLSINKCGAYTYCFQNNFHTISLPNVYVK